jgi:hypothetical protein
MKRMKFLTGMLAMALVFGMMVVGCDTGGGGGGSAPDSVVGIWEADMTTPEGQLTIRLTFTDKNVTITQNGVDAWTSPYTLPGNTITVGGEQVWTVSGNTISIPNGGTGGGTIILTKKS